MTSPVGAKLRRAIPLCRLYPRLPGSFPDSGSTSPVARLASPGAAVADLPGCPARRPQPPAPPRRLPGSVSPTPSTHSPEGLQQRKRIIPRPIPLRLVNPVGPPNHRDRHCWLPRFAGTVPRVPVGVRLPVWRYVAPHLLAGQEVFFSPQGYPQRNPVSHRSFPFIHR